MQAPENAEWDMCLAIDEPWCWVHQAPMHCPPCRGYVSLTPCCSFTNCSQSAGLDRSIITASTGLDWAGTNRFMIDLKCYPYVGPM